MTTDASILSALREGQESGISGAALSLRLGISRAAIWARIEELRKLGYEIEASPHAGYRLIKVPDVLHADDLMTRLPEHRILGRDIRVFKSTTSTNDVVEKLARDGVAEGVVVFAESQSKGRGRMSRRWESSHGKGLYFSILLRPKCQPQAATRITIVAATALTRAIRSCTALEPEIKWPNDLQIRGRKIAGVLTELSAELDSVRYLILGIGLNVNQAREDFPEELRDIATSLFAESGQRVDRALLAARILEELEVDYAKVQGGRFDEVAAEWERQCNTLGKNVTIQVGGRQAFGRAESLDGEGALLLRTHHGTLERIMGGDVTVVK